MTCRFEEGITYLQTYNAENRLSKVQKLATGTCAEPLAYEAEWDFAYDGDGVRTATLVTEYLEGMPQPAELRQYYFGGAYEVTNGAVRKYYALAGQMVAVRAYDPSTSTWSLSYLITDHLGSIVAVTDADGALLSQQRYLPFGQVREDAGAVTQTDFGYTSQRNLPEMGLMDYKARMYDPSLSRWIQSDSITPDITNPQSLNRYSYVINGPLRYSDPTGHRPVEEEGGSTRGCSDPIYCRNHRPKPTEELKRLHEVKSCIGTPKPPNSNIDQFMEFLRFDGELINVFGRLEDVAEYGRPAYKQIKYVAPLGPLEYGIDGALQLYDDRKEDLNPFQRGGRAAIVSMESAGIDLMSNIVGLAAAGGLQAGVPVPVVSAGAGFGIGAYATSAILTEAAHRVNPTIFSAFGLGGP